MTNIFGAGSYCCLCFDPIDVNTCTVLNGVKWDTCRPCEDDQQRKVRVVLLRLRHENEELKAELYRLKQDKL